MRIGLYPGAWTNFASFLLTGAGALTGATSDQPLVQFIGFAGMVFGLLVLLWGVTIDGKQWWRGWHKPRRPKSNWLTLPQALWHIISESEKSSHFEFDDWEAAQNALVQEFLEAAALSEIRVRGHRRVNKSGDGYRLTATSEEIPPEFWRFAEFQPFYEVFIAISPEERKHPDPLRPAVWANRSKYPEAKSAFYGRVIVNTADVLAKWPRPARSLFRKAAPPRLKLAFKKHMIDTFGTQDWQDGEESDMIFANE